MRLVMKTVSWLVFLAFIGLSSFANWKHGGDPLASFMLAVVPVGFAMSIFILEGMMTAGKAGRWTYTAVTFVALAAGVASYLGLFGMARDHGIPLVQAALMPLAFDGVVAVASMGIRAFSVGHVPVATPALADPEPVATPEVPATPDVVATPDVQDEPVAKPVKVPSWVAEAKRLQADGLTREEIAVKLDKSERTIRRYLPAADLRTEEN